MASTISKIVPFSEPTFSRCIHDSKHPFTRISNDLIRDRSISPECRWLLMFLLSNDDGWEITISQLINHLAEDKEQGFKRHCGKTKIYALVNEAISAGYIKREKYKDEHEPDPRLRNLERIRYFVSEYPKFKKSFRSFDFREAEDRDPENQTLRTTILKNEQKEEEKEISKERVHKDKPDKKPKAPEEPPSAEAEALTVFFLEKIKERLPDFKITSYIRETWVKSFDKLLRLDGRRSTEVMGLILWASEHRKYWRQALLSPLKLRRRDKNGILYYDIILIEMQKDFEKNIINPNRQWAIEQKEKYSLENFNLRQFTFDSEFAINMRTNEKISFNQSSEEFKYSFRKMFGGNV